MADLSGTDMNMTTGIIINDKQYKIDIHGSMKNIISFR